MLKSPKRITRSRLWDTIPGRYRWSDPAQSWSASAGEEIGVVLTCVADMAIGRLGDRIYSMASPNQPEGFKPKGLCCGFVKVKTLLKAGEIVKLKDKRRSISVMIVDDIRPHQDGSASDGRDGVMPSRNAVEEEAALGGEGFEVTCSGIF